MSTLSVSEAKLIDLYRVMIRIRTFETTARKLTAEGRLPARFGLYTGQEAVAAGVSAHLKPTDQMGSTHRPVGHLIAKGCDLPKLLAELCGRSGGFNKGKAGPYHVFDPSVGALGANGIVGASVPMSCGYALANQLRANGSITVSYFGEGACNQGGVQEALNLAACWNLPVVFVCENSSPEVQRMLGHEMDYPQLTIDKVAIRAKAYNIPGYSGSGWDVEEVYKAAGKAIRRARAGKGPSLIEFKVHQLEGNLEGRLETSEKDRKWDPISQFKDKYKAILPKKLDDAIRAEEAAAVIKAVDFTLASPDPAPGEAYTDVFAEGT